MLAKIHQHYSQNPYYWLGGIGSALMTMIIFSHHQPFNVDGLIYLQGAQAFLDGNVKQAIAIYNWPFYSLLIAFTSKVSHLSILNAAYALTFIFPIITTLAFLALIKELGGTRKTLLLATLIIIIFPHINHTRDNLLRDVGYIPCFLLATLFLIRYVRTPNWANAIGWNLSIVLATLFRFEGIIFAISIPMAYFLIVDLPLQHRLKNSLRLSIIILSFAVIALTAMLIGKIFAINIIPYFGKMNHLIGLWNTDKHIFLNNYVGQAHYVAERLNDFSRPFPISAFTGTMFGLFTWKLISTTSPLYFFISLYGMLRKYFTTDPIITKMIYAMIMTNIVIIIVFMGLNYFVSSRYLLPLAMLLLLWVPFSLERLLKYKLLILPIVLIITVMFIDSVHHFGTSKTYIIDAGKWLSKNSTINDKIYTNNQQIIFYADRRDIYAKNNFEVANVNPQLFNDYRYLAIRIDDDDAELRNQLIQRLGTQPIMQFENRRRDKIVIFTKSH